MERLIIIGAGGFGREVLAWAKDALRTSGNFNIAGFLDKDAAALNAHGYLRQNMIIGDPDTYQPGPNDVFICAIGDTTQKLDVCRRLKDRGAHFVRLIHPTAVIGNSCRLGEGCILCPGTILTSDVTLGNYVTLNVHTTVGHDAVIGDGCTLSAHCDVTGFVRLGQGVFMGSHASVLPGIIIGDFARIGAGSVVLRNVPQYATVMGVPAKQVVWSDTLGNGEKTR